MRVAIIGTGLVGLGLAKRLCEYPEIDEIICADINPLQLNRALREVKSDKLFVELANAERFEDASKVISKADAVFNGAPSWAATSNILQACLDLGAHYIDAGLGTFALLETLKRHEMFRDAGILALPSLGTDPGISNVLAAYLAHHFEQVDEIRIRDGGMAKLRGREIFATYSLTTFLRECAVRPIVYENGVFKRVPPLSREEDFAFPPPVGPAKVYAVEHEEPVTLPQSIGKGVRYVDFKLALTRDVLQSMRVLLKLGLLSDAPVEVKGARVAPRDLLVALLSGPQDAERMQHVEGFEAIMVKVSGRRKGEEASASAFLYMTHRDALSKYGETATVFLTSLGIAIGIRMLAKGEVRGTGVMPPEKLDLLAYLSYLAEQGVVPIFEGVEPPQLPKLVARQEEQAKPAGAA
jgi:saccharopine dehydrogenase (NAD+, L-lysine-forming)